MTSVERQRLADIERSLTAESPELARLLSGDRRSGGRSSRRWLAGALTAGLVAGLVAVGLSTGVTALAVFALCPALTHVVVLLGCLRLPVVLSGRRILRRHAG